VKDASVIIVPKLPNCTPAQQQALTGNADSTSTTTTPPICNPGKDLLPVAVAKLTQVFNAIGTNLPPAWRLSDTIQRAAATASQRPNGPPPVSFADLNRVRGWIWLDSRLVALIFLIPIGLFAIIMMVTIRSAKSLFRWLGWGLIASGLIAL